MGGDHGNRRGAKQQQWASSKKGGRQGTIGNWATSRWADDPRSGWCGAELSRNHQEPGGRKMNRADGERLVGLHNNK